MRLADLMGVLGVTVSGSARDIDVTGVKSDSRQVVPGDLFVAIQGIEADGHRFIPQALQKGAVAVVCQEPPEGVAAPVFVSPDTRIALSLLAAQFHGHPSKKMRLIGVTGTKGKTTTTSLIRRILVDAGFKTGLLGTINNIVCDIETPAKLTTPESTDIQSAFDDMSKCGTRYAVMEVSSHSLALHRVDSCEYDTGVFTNLTQDHLDYHQTMENYLEAKTILFRSLGKSYFGPAKSGPKTSVLNADESASDYIRSVSSAPVLTYGITNNADVRARDISYASGKSAFTVDTPSGSIDLHLMLAGRINVYNSIAAMSCALIEGVSLADQKRTLESITGMPGRFERVDAGQKFCVIVDYAHSPGALLNVLNVARDMTDRRVFVVVGCGGDRDRKKRPIMGRIAGELSDFAVITSDNPRSEDPEAILDEIEAGIRGTPPKLGYLREVDREKAIRSVIAAAAPGDVVLIAGKGHETYQIFRDRTIHFDDREVAMQALIERRASEPGVFEREV